MSLRIAPSFDAADELLVRDRVLDRVESTEQQRPDLLDRGGEARDGHYLRLGEDQIDVLRWAAVTGEGDPSEIERRIDMFVQWHPQTLGRVQVAVSRAVAP